jgi:hypothetical protein
MKHERRRSVSGGAAAFWRAQDAGDADDSSRGSYFDIVVGAHLQPGDAAFGRVARVSIRIGAEVWMIWRTRKPVSPASYARISRSRLRPTAYARHPALSAV